MPIFMTDYVATADPPPSTNGVDPGEMFELRLSPLTHTLWSDGNEFPEMVAVWYKEKGYDFLALSDHNLLSRGERWMPVPAVEARRKVKGGSTMDQYRAKFGDDWVETRSVEQKGTEAVTPPEKVLQKAQ